MPRLMLALGLLVSLPICVARADNLSALRGHYVIEPSSHIGFSVAQVGGGGIDGVFSRFSGAFDLRPDDIAHSSVAFSLEPASVATGQARVEDFLRSSAVLDAAAYPAITFRSASIHCEGAERALIQGVLTARGVSRRETFEATLVRQQGKTVAFHVVGTLLRSLYGMDVGTPIYSNVARFDMMLDGRRD